MGFTADPLILAPREHHLYVLLVRRTEEPQKGRWALPGGFVSRDETPLQTAQRKLTEKTGVGELYLEQLATFGDPGRDPRGWIPSIAYLALTHAVQLADTENAGWFPVRQLPPMAFDHAAMVAMGVERLSGKLWWSNIAFGLLPARFTMRDARELFESITETRLDPSNFRRELERSGMVQRLGQVLKDGPGRPAPLYEFKERQLAWIPGRLRPTRKRS